MENCLFCRIIAGEIPAHKVYEDDQTVVIMDIRPASEGHMLVIPKTHAAELHHLPAEAALATMRTTQRVEAALRQSDLQPTASNLWINNGPDAGQEIAHLHLHIVPRYPHDGIRIHVPNRPAEGGDLAAIAQKIARNLPGG